MPDSSEGTALLNALSSTKRTGVCAARKALDHPHANPYDVDAAQTRFDASLARYAEAQTSEDATAELHEATAELENAAAQLNKATGQSGDSWALPHQAPKQAWTSRRLWLTDLTTAITSEEGRALCKQQRLSVKACVAVAQANAAFGSSSSGRSVTASNYVLGRAAARFAGRAKDYSHDVVRAARSVFEALGFAVEVARGRYLTAAERVLAKAHHGGDQIRAASVWALVSPRRPAPLRSNFPYLTPRGFTPRRVSCRSYSPTRSRKRSPAPSGRFSRQNRPLDAQIVAAHLIQNVPSLDRGHIGAIVDVIIGEVDYTRWTGRDLATLINLDARRRGIDWPSKIDRPASFLRHRLHLVAADLAAASPSEIATSHAAQIRAEQQKRTAEAEQAKLHAAKPTTVRAAVNEFKAILEAKRAKRRR